MTEAFKDPPDFTNELGVKWWRDTALTDYARKPDGHGRRLRYYTCWFVEEPTGRQTRLLLDQDSYPVYECQQLDGMGCYIDMLKLNQAFDDLTTLPSPDNLPG